MERNVRINGKLSNLFGIKGETGMCDVPVFI